MYRNLSTILLCISAVLGAPQKDSNITYIKINQQPEFLYASQEATYSEEGQKELASNLSKDAKLDASVIPLNDAPLLDYSERSYSIKRNKKIKKPATDNNTTAVEVFNDTAILSADSLPSESLNTDIFLNTELATQNIDNDVTANYELATEKFGEDLTIPTHIDVDETTKEPIVGVAFPPKLSHYGKSIIKSFSQNLIATSGKGRRFKSRCHCEKIWNCTKLQISIARCPDEYFLCCG